MYIAGLNLSHNQGLESLVWVSTIGGFYYQIKKSYGIVKLASAKGGDFKPVPTPFLGKLAGMAHGIALFGPLLKYIIETPINGFEQPAAASWTSEYALPDDNISVGTKAAIRFAGAFIYLGCSKFVGVAYDHLGSQWGFIGVRSKPKLVNTGPYRYVRHPLYSCVLVCQFSLALMSWSYIPLYSMAVAAAAFAVKMPIEEQLIENDIEIGLAYRMYKLQTRYKIIPYIW